MVTALLVWRGFPYLSSFGLRGGKPGGDIETGQKLAKEVSFVTPGSITIDYPTEGSVFPPEFPAPTWLWRDAEDKATSWEVNVTFFDGTPTIRALSAGERMRVGESDPRCVSPTNEPPALTPKQAAAHTWMPDAATWAAIKDHSVGRQPLSSLDIAKAIRRRSFRAVRFRSKHRVTRLVPPFSIATCRSCHPRTRRA